MATAFSISNWYAWTNAPPFGTSAESVLHSDNPDTTAIPPMLRRRLNLLGKATASCALKLLGDRKSIPMVYCSRHGDLSRSLSVLQENAEDLPVSPTNFSLAVHNAICGIISIDRKLNSNIVTLSSADGLVPMLLESIALLGESHSEVLCLAADVPPPEIYRSLDDLEPAHAFCAGFIVSSRHGQALQLENTSCKTAAPAASALDLARFMSSSDGTLSTTHNGGHWQLSRRSNG